MLVSCNFTFTFFQGLAFWGDVVNAIYGLGNLYLGALFSSIFGLLFGFNFNLPDIMFGSDEEDGEFDGDLGFDPHCDCPNCRAARAAYEASQTSLPF